MMMMVMVMMMMMMTMELHCNNLLGPCNLEMYNNLLAESLGLMPPDDVEHLSVRRTAKCAMPLCFGLMVYVTMRTGHVKDTVLADEPIGTQMNDA